jgi:hypothetical protein
MSELLWTAVPGGTDAGGSRLLRVLVVPKLDGGTLEGSSMATWPPEGLLQAQSLAVDWRADEGATAVETAVVSADITFHVQPDLWQRFFDPSTVVGTSRRAPALHPQPEVRPTSELASSIDATFARPAAAAFVPDDSALPEGYDALVLGGLEQWSGEDPPPPPPPDMTPPPPPPDFHRVISLLREHPAVLRALGLIFDLRVTPPAQHPELADAGQVRVRWPGASADAALPAIVSPWTRYGHAFLPFSASGRISAGMVTLTPDPAGTPSGENGRWKVVTVDVEGGARKLRDAARIVKDAGGGTAAVDPRLPVSLPAMRSAGLQLVRVGRHEDFAERRGVALANEARGTLEEHVLDADDLVLGYRIDIKRGGGKWLSLHERVANYDVNGAPIGEPGTVEEGHVKANGAVRETDGVLRADETVARWSGWSLAVARPRFDAGPGPASAPGRGGLPFEFTFEFAANPKSLPALRFAAQYALRARVVDMAGGGLECDDPAADRCAITQISYGRYEPVLSPGLTLEAGVAHEQLGPAEAVDRIVVRSGPGVSVDAFPASNPGYVTHARRSLHRPHTSLEIAELHKMLDRTDDEQTFEWVARALAAADTAPEAPEPAEGPLPDPAAGGVQAVPQPEPGAPAAAFARRDWTKRWPEPEPPKALELRDRATGQAPVTWEGETLVVRLKPAEQLTLEVSSTLTEDFFDHFALKNDASKEAAEVGRNPLITPARAVTLVHALRQPIWEPGTDLRLDPQEREPGQTFAILDPVPGFLRLDANSTSQLDIGAEWKERSDDGAPPKVTSATVQTVGIDRGDTALKDELRHEFGDTRHRDVTYTLTAVTRFRQYFKRGEEAQDPDAFVVRTPLTVPVNIRSTARPAPPVVLAARPAFVWKESAESGPGVATLRRQRLGGRLRVELARPWYQTGDGERLAVILWDRTGVAPPEGLRGLITQVGRDPIWQTPDPERWPTEQMLAGMVDATAATKLLETGNTVFALPYETWFHNDRWYADVALPGVAASSYCPFVQLAVARYQRDSITDHDLSPVVRTDMVQLQPDRTLTVRRSGELLFVALEGLGPAAPVANRVDVVLEHCDLPPGMDAADVDLTAFAPPGAGMPAWAPLPGGTRQTGLGAGAVQLPIPPGPGALRVRVREVELIGGEPGPQTATPGELTERVVFTDAVMPPAL